MISLFSKNIHKRIKIVLLIVIIVFIIIIAKVFYIEVIDYKKLNKLANGLWSRNLPVTADRGLILDRNGKVLAENITTASLVLIPNQIKNKDEEHLFEKIKYNPLFWSNNIKK